MKITWTAGSVAVLFLISLLTVLGIVLYFKRAAIGAWLKSLAGTTFNPASPGNVVNKGVTSLVSSATGREETFGGMLAEWFNPATRAVADSLKIKSNTVTPEQMQSDFFYGAP